MEYNQIPYLCFSKGDGEDGNDSGNDSGNGDVSNRMAMTTNDKRERRWEFRWQCDSFDGVVIVIVCVCVLYCIFHFSSEKK